MRYISKHPDRKKVGTLTGITWPLRRAGLCRSIESYGVEPDSIEANGVKSGSVQSVGVEATSIEASSVPLWDGCSNSGESKRCNNENSEHFK